MTANGLLRIRLFHLQTHQSWQLIFSYVKTKLILVSCQYLLDMVTWKQANDNVLAYYWPRQKHAPNEHLQLRFIVMMSNHYLHMSIISLFTRHWDARKLFWIIFGLVIGQIIKLTFFYFCASLLLLVANRYFEPFFLLKLVPWIGCPRLTMGEHVKRRSS